MSYTQLTEIDRHQIYTLLKNDFTQRAIATELGVSESRVSREISRNKGARGYRPKQAHKKALERRHGSEKYRRLTEELKTTISAYLQKDWSPEQITGHLKNEGESWVSHETIYQLVVEDKSQGGTLHQHLRRSHKKYKKRYGGSDRRGAIKDRVSIDDRPRHIEKRNRIGDWEIDTIIGKNHKKAVVTIVDRLSLMTFIAKVDYKKAELVSEATITLLTPYSGQATWTITGDNGKEFSGHKKISEALGADFYFAHPYSSWERGTNENTNGLIRQYLPKGSPFDNVTEEQCQWIMERLNNRPRKCLGYRTPKQVFEQFLEAT